MNCDRCADLREHIPIRTPADLRQALRVARDNLADDTIRAVEGALPADDAISDGISCEFACAACDHRFFLGLGPDGKGGGSWSHAPGPQAQKAEQEARRAARIASFPPRGSVKPVAVAGGMPCAQIEPWPCAAQELGEGASRIGGEPYLPDGFAWPEYRGQPLDFLCQFDLAEVPPGLGLPPDGLLSFFYSVAENADDGLLVHYRPVDDPVPLARFEADPEDEGIPESHGVGFVPGANLPGEQGAIVDHHLGGHADFLQDEKAPKGCRLLLQLGGDTHPLGFPWDGAGRLYFWIPEKDLAARKFGRCRVTFQAD